MATERQLRWWMISPNTEILFMGILGMGSTLMEESIMNVKETLVEIWALSFSSSLFTQGLERLIKSIMSGIVLARAFTIHLYLASYLLLIYPAIMEKMRIMLVFWLILSALRSILLNAIAAFTGFVICACYPELKPVCFEFVTVKAVELACSIYMWVNVHDFYYSLKRLPSATRSESPRFQKMVEKRRSRRERDSEDSVYSWNAQDRDDMLTGSLDSLQAQAVVDWFMRNIERISGSPKDIKPQASGTTSTTDMATNLVRFLEMDTEEILRLKEKLLQLIGEVDPLKSKLMSNIIPENATPLKIADAPDDIKEGSEEMEETAITHVESGEDNNEMLDVTESRSYLELHRSGAVGEKDNSVEVRLVSYDDDLADGNDIYDPDVGNDTFFHTTKSWRPGNKSNTCITAGPYVDQKEQLENSTELDISCKRLHGGKINSNHETVSRVDKGVQTRKLSHRALSFLDKVESEVKRNPELEGSVFSISNHSDHSSL